MSWEKIYEKRAKTKTEDETVKEKITGMKHGVKDEKKGNKLKDTSPHTLS